MCQSDCTDTIPRSRVSSLQAWRGMATQTRDVLGHWLKRTVLTLYEWDRRRRYRGYLAVMDDRGLNDIGISRLDAEREADRPVWLPPALDETARGRRQHF